MPTSRSVAWTAVAISVLTVLGAGAAVTQQHRDMAALKRQVTDLGSTVDIQRQNTASALKTAQANTTAAQSRIAALSAQLAATQNQLAGDEKKLQVTANQLPPDLAKLADAVSPSVVLISCGAELGSGFAMRLRAATAGMSTIVTAAHVVQSCAPTASNTTPDMPAVTVGSRTIAARIQSIDTDGDVALLTVGATVPPLRVSTSTPRPGDFVMTVGNPLGAQALANSVTQGNVSKVLQDVLSNTASISNGNSGGPLVNRSGDVVGIIDSALTSASVGAPVVENLNFAVRLRVLCNVVLTGSACAGLP